MGQELHEQILLYLFQFRDDGEFHDILAKFNDRNKKLIRETINELATKKFIRENPSLRVITGEPDRYPRKDTLKAKILIDGINFVKEKLLKPDEPKETKQHIVIKGQVGVFQNVTAPNSGTISPTVDSSLTQLSRSRKKIEIKNETKHPIEKPSRKMTIAEKWTIILSVIAIIVTVLIAYLTN